MNEIEIKKMIMTVGKVDEDTVNRVLKETDLENNPALIARFEESMQKGFDEDEFKELLITASKQPGKPEVI